MSRVSQLLSALESTSSPTGEEQGKPVKRYTITVESDYECMDVVIEAAVEYMVESMPDFRAASFSAKDEQGVEFFSADYDTEAAGE